MGASEHTNQWVLFIGKKATCHLDDWPRQDKNTSPWSMDVQKKKTW
jgi:hypothetical protein